MNTKPLWEILVPTGIGNKGKRVPFAHHKAWDDFVEKISGGLTIQKTAKGIWVCPTTSGRFTDRMIPVRLTATEEEIHKIINFTIRHYEQEAVMAYKISNTVIIKERKEICDYCDHSDLDHPVGMNCIVKGCDCIRFEEPLPL